MSAIKHDTHKPKLTKIDPMFLMALARVLEGGDLKYGEANWMVGLLYSRILDAMKRHTLAIEMGEDIDPESGEPHTAHIASGAMILDYYRRHNRSDLDDRRFKAVCGDVQVEVTQANVFGLTPPEERLHMQEVRESGESGQTQEKAGDIETLQERIATWADKIFPDRTAHGALTKLVMEEISELLCDLDDPLEYADVLILILDVAKLRGIDAVAAAHEKMAINEKRHWAIDRHTGLMHHIKELDENPLDQMPYEEGANEMADDIFKWATTQHTGMMAGIANVEDLPAPFHYKPHLDESQM